MGGVGGLVLLHGHLLVHLVVHLLVNVHPAMPLTVQLLVLGYLDE